MTGRLLVSIPEAARMLGVGKTLLYAMLNDGRLGPAPIKLGNKTLLRVSDLRDWVAANCPPRAQWLPTAAETATDEEGR